VRPPVFLRRRPDEPLDQDLASWYRSLIAAVGASGMRLGQWRLLDVNGWPDNQTCRNLLAWSWSRDGTDRHVVVVNLSGAPSQGRVPLAWADLGGRPWQLTDLLAGATFEREGTELADPGLFVSLDPWHSHVLVLR
jgi:hypothetical protein